MIVGRRALLGGFATFPLVALVSSPPLLAACGNRAPDTPLAHLYGKEWVHGAYELYAKRYAGVQEAADATSHDAYRILAQKGVTALDALQSRDVPFYVRVDSNANAFGIERKVPERLTFTADMTEDDRRAAQAAWKKARDHIHKDYEEVRRLDWALSRMLAQIQLLRNAIEEGRIEQFRMVEQLAELKKDPTQLPYELPYKVTPKDYEEILLLLLERLEDDRARLARIEAEVVAVSLTTRTTDANSATLAASIKKVLVAVVEEGDASKRAPVFPADEGEKARLLERARAIAVQIEASPEYKRWRDAEREKKLAAIGVFLQAVDAMTGLSTSQVYRTVLEVLRGDQDYFTYVKTIIAFMPRGGKVASTLLEAIEYTEKARRIAGQVKATVDAVKGGDSQSLVAAATAQLDKHGSEVLLNTASRFAVERVDKQLAFFKDREEVKRVEAALAETDLVTKVMPSIPRL